MLVIRLARGGRKKYPVYRIVAAEKRRAATGKFVAVLGHYNPHTKDLVIKKDELKKFIENLEKKCIRPYIECSKECSKKK